MPMHDVVSKVLIVMISLLFTHQVAAQSQSSQPQFPQNVADLPPGEYAQQQAQRQQDYQRVMDLLMPLSEQQINQVIRALDVNERAASAPPSPPPAPVMAVSNLSLSARTPPVVRVAQGYGASIVFTDNTGKSWPMTAYQGFNDGLFVVKANTISGDKEDLPTVLTIQPTAAYGMGNALVTLKGLETPIVLSIALGQSEVDVRHEYRLSIPGPNAKKAYKKPLPARVEPTLLNVLNGLPPVSKATPVNLSGVEPEARAWQVGQHYYIRTQADIYSPAYEQRASSPSGVHAYKIHKTPVMLASHNGSMTELLINQ